MLARLYAADKKQMKYTTVSIRGKNNKTSVINKSTKEWEERDETVRVEPNGQIFLPLSR